MKCHANIRCCNKNDVESAVMKEREFENDMGKIREKGAKRAREGGKHIGEYYRCSALIKN